MNQSAIKVSIIIPAYNVEKYIERCLKSAINQTLKAVEVIVVNDGSTDSTKTIIEYLAKQDSKVVVVNQKNSGVASARNAALEVANGEYIQYLDGDDWMEKETSEELYNYAKEKDLDIVVSDYWRDFDNGDIEYAQDTKFEGIFNGEEYLKKLFLGKDCFSVLWNKLFKSSLYVDVKHPMCISRSDDYVVLVDMALKVKRMGKINKAYTHWVLNPDSFTQFEVSKTLYQVFKAHDEIEYRLKKNGKYGQYKDDLLLLRHRAFTGFFILKPFYSNNDYQKGLNYMLSYLKQNDNPKKNTGSSRHILVRILKIFPYKVVFYSLNLIFYLSPF